MSMEVGLACPVMPSNCGTEPKLACLGEKFIEPCACSSLGY